MGNKSITPPWALEFAYAPTGRRQGVADAAGAGVGGQNGFGCAGRRNVLQQGLSPTLWMSIRREQVEQEEVDVVQLRPSRCPLRLAKLQIQAPGGGLLLPIRSAFAVELAPPGHPFLQVFRAGRPRLQTFWIRLEGGNLQGSLRPGSRSLPHQRATVVATAKPHLDHFQRDMRKPAQVTPGRFQIGLPGIFARCDAQVVGPFPRFRVTVRQRCACTTSCAFLQKLSP